ncbi:dpy-19-like protein 2 [Heterocephalus glaber]|uniref:Dpy-19-like protein 2 n=1 Tax=Heterocephalus glaber TaxID=10181 RepID=G5C820_HETGA|nr:dpy-19-like protein 2 [Heterocephalus glaber]
MLNNLCLFKGLGDPACFYVGVIFILNGLMMGLFFIYATYLSGSHLGGLITVLCYFFNHGEATRVMWAPPLRESFACPFLVLQMYILTMILRSSNNYGKHYIALCLANVAFMLPWEFAQFILFTQLIQGCAWWFGTIILKLLTAEILGVSDHISLTDLIAARILRYTDFDTLMYTCAPETYFMEQALVFHALQLLAFAALAILILRLKLFLTPHMCVMASLICSQRLFGWLFRRFHFESVIFGILTVMSIQGCANLRNQWSIRGEFTNLPQEELLQWIKYNTRPGTMQTMASIKLSTLHPIVNHPHYEDADLRARTKIAYSVYSRKSAKEVRNKLLALHVNYYVLEESWCIWKTKPGCSMLEIWDLEDPSNSANPSLCSTLLRDARPYFTIVFQNTLYRVLKVNRERDYTSIL